jgi:hypothetical protein
MEPGPFSEVREMLHHCGLWNEWDSERAFVASVMQHTIEPERYVATPTGTGNIPRKVLSSPCY